MKSAEPQTTADRICQAAMFAAEAFAKAEGVELKVCVVQLQIVPPEGESIAATSAAGIEDDWEMLVWMLEHLTGFAESIGQAMNVTVIDPTQN